MLTAAGGEPGTFEGHKHRKVKPSEHLATLNSGLKTPKQLLLVHLVAMYSVFHHIMFCFLLLWDKHGPDSEEEDEFLRVQSGCKVFHKRVVKHSSSPTGYAAFQLL